MQTAPANLTQEEYRLKQEKCKLYLQMITMAICERQGNMGLLRKSIWDYLLKNFKQDIDYRDFLLAIRELCSQGKLSNNGTGYYTVNRMLQESMFFKNDVLGTPSRNSLPENQHIKQQYENLRRNEKLTATGKQSHRRIAAPGTVSRQLTTEKLQQKPRVGGSISVTSRRTQQKLDRYFSKPSVSVAPKFINEHELKHLPDPMMDIQKPEIRQTPSGERSAKESPKEKPKS